MATFPVDTNGEMSREIVLSMSLIVTGQRAAAISHITFKVSLLWPQYI